MMTSFRSNYEIINSMVLLVDTREQETVSLQNRIKSCGLPTERTKLDVGDYSLKYVDSNGEEQRLPVAIERKMNIDELAMCFTCERKRFEREFERAKENKVKVYLLVENTLFEDIYTHNYRSKMLPQALIQSMLAFSTRYDCQIFFCRQQTTGRLIRDILTRELKEIIK